MKILLQKTPKMNKYWYIFMIMPSFLAWIFFGSETWVIVFMSINAIINIVIFIINNKNKSRTLLNSIIFLFIIFFLWFFMTKRTQKLKDEFLKEQKVNF